MVHGLVSRSLHLLARRRWARNWSTASSTRGPDVDLDLIEVEIHAIAERMKIGVWDDTGLSEWLDEIVAREARRKVGVR